MNKVYIVYRIEVDSNGDDRDVIIKIYNNRISAENYREAATNYSRAECGMYPPNEYYVEEYEVLP